MYAHHQAIVPFAKAETLDWDSEDRFYSFFAIKVKSVIQFFCPSVTYPQRGNDDAFILPPAACLVYLQIQISGIQVVYAALYRKFCTDLYET